MQRTEAMRKKRFTYDQHDALGEELQVMRDRFVKIVCELSKAYPIKDKVTGQASKIVDEIDQLRNQMENLLYRDHPKAHDRMTMLSTYYRRDRDEKTTYRRPECEEAS